MIEGLSFNGSKILDFVGEDRLCVVCDKKIGPGMTHYEYGFGSQDRRYACAPCHKVIGGQIPRDKEIAILRAERDEARDWVRRMTNQNQTLTCVYCGMAYPPGTPTHGSDVLTAHIKVCPKHPMRRALFACELIRGVRHCMMFLKVHDEVHAKEICDKYGVISVQMLAKLAEEEASAVLEEQGR